MKSFHRRFLENFFRWCFYSLFIQYGLVFCSLLLVSRFHWLFLTFCSIAEYRILLYCRIPHSAVGFHKNKTLILLVLWPPPNILLSHPRTWVCQTKKKRAASDVEIANGEALIDNGLDDPKNGIQVDNDLNESTMGEKLANLNLIAVNETRSPEKSSPRTKPPSADSVHVLLKQALRADDRALLMDCLYRQDEKVVANSVSSLNPSDVLKLLQSLVSIFQSRGAVLVCALPWLRNLLLQHASGIMSQESSLLALNTLYQLIESRVSTFNEALQLSTSLDLLYAGTVDEGEDENEAVIPAFYEEKDESNESISVDAMETESDENGQEPQTVSDISDFEAME